MLMTVDIGQQCCEGISRPEHTRTGAQCDYEPHDQMASYHLQLESLPIDDPARSKYEVVV